MEYFQLTNAHQLSWTLHGVFFGYPPCCIAEFVATFERTHRKLNGTGYVPCKQCNARYTSQQLIERINLHRKCGTPFPNAQYRLPRFEEARLQRLRAKWYTVGLPFNYKRLQSLSGALNK